MMLTINSDKAMHYALGSEAGLLRDLSAGRVPEAWTPLETSTTEEVVFLARSIPSAPTGEPGFARFVTFLGADKLDATAIREPLLRRRACAS